MSELRLKKKDQEIVFTIPNESAESNVVCMDGIKEKTGIQLKQVSTSFSEEDKMETNVILLDKKPVSK